MTADVHSPSRPKSASCAVGFGMVIALFLVACGNDAEPDVASPDDNGLAAWSLEQVPTSMVEADRVVMIEFGRPVDVIAAVGSGADDPALDQLGATFEARSGERGGFAPLPISWPEVQQALVDVEAFVDELGFWPYEAERYVTSSVGAQQFAVFDGGGAAVSERAMPYDGDLLTIGEGVDGAAALDQRSALRPLGRPYRVASVDEAVALSTSSELVASWAENGGGTLLGDELIAAAARSLDEYGVVSGVAYVDLADDASIRMSMVGMVPGDPATAVVVEAFADAAATPSVDELEGRWTRDDPGLDGLSLSDALRVNSSNVDDAVATIVLEPVPGTSTLVVVDALLRNLLVVD